MSSLYKCLFSPFVHFWIGLFVGGIVIELYELFVYFGNLLLVGSNVCKNFDPIGRLSFHLVYTFLSCGKAFKFH